MAHWPKVSVRLCLQACDFTSDLEMVMTLCERSLWSSAQAGRGYMRSNDASTTLKTTINTIEELNMKWNAD